MKPKQTIVDTPVGKFQGPMSPAFAQKLAKCKTNEDLFAIVEPGPFMDPDAFNEICARGLCYEYQQWKKRTTTVAGSKTF